MELKSLIIQRGQVKRRVTFIVKELESALVDQSLIRSFVLDNHKEKLDSCYSEYLAKHCEILSLDPPDVDEQDAKYDEFERLHIRAIDLLAQLKSKLPPNPVPQVQGVASPGNVVPHVIVQQQPLKAPIPSFDGKYENWPKFKALFTDVVGRCGDSDATKIHYLDRALVGEAAGLLDAKVVSDNNYQRAWQLLVDRYDNLRVIVDTHLSGLLDMRPMQKECFKELRNLLDTCKRHVEGLKYLDQPIDGTSGLIITKLLTKCLDPESRKQWEKSLKHGELPKYEKTLEFLTAYCQVLERCENDSSSQSKGKSANSIHPIRSPVFKTSSPATSVPEIKCDFCHGQHQNFKCSSFMDLSIDDRQARVKDLNLCFNCLKRGHRSSNCLSEKTCNKCSRKHHTLVHFEKLKPMMTNSVLSSEELESGGSGSIPINSEVNVSCSSTYRSSPKQVFLMTAVVNVYSRDGSCQPVRVLLDSGSQVNFLSESAVKRLGLPKFPASVPVIGVGGARSNIKHKVLVRVSSAYSDFKNDVDCLVTTRITGTIPTVEVDPSSWNIPSGITLADPNFYRPGEVEMLLGAELFFRILKQARIHLSDHLPSLCETQFGWVVGGAYSNAELNASAVVCASAVTDDSLETCMQRFFAQEEVQCDDVLNREEQEVEDHFRETYRRTNDGRFIVQLPFRDTLPQLSDSRSLALRRFFLLEKRFAKDPQLKEEYSKFIKEYQELGHCQQIEESDTRGVQSYYLPHHAVLKPSSSSTKLRVVFDATAKSRGMSLNDVLKVGPVMQSDLFTIVLRFRKHLYAFSGDVSKMYRQVLVDPSQTRYQRIFWRENPDEALKVLELKTVTYGTSAASFLAVRSVIQLARDEQPNYPDASEAILDDCYMDDVLTGSSTIEKAKQLRKDIEEVMSKGGFPVRKWCSNSEEVLDDVPEEDREVLMDIGECGPNEVIKALGILWDPKRDEFLFFRKRDAFVEEAKITKRSVLSQIASLFDPIGLISPVVVMAKIIMQELWQAKVGWDDPIDGDLASRWSSFQGSLDQLNEIRVQRCVIPPNFSYLEIHGFADASDKAYGACIYLRAVLPNGKAQMCLLCSKSKVAPLKGLTIPKLELCAALLLARLVEKVVPLMKLEIRSVKLWSDSQIVLAWLKKDPNKLLVFVRNRVAEINQLSSSYQWSYVRTNMNPADIVSRGLTPAELARSELWWNGPRFLVEEVFEEDVLIDLPEELIPEMKKHVVVNAATEKLDPEPVLTRFSSFSKLQRVMAHVVRFVRLVRSSGQQRSSSRFLTVDDMRSSLTAIIRMLQRETLDKEISSLMRGEVPKQFKSLMPFLDDKGLMRVGGRLQNSSLPFDAKHQLMLPADHHVTRILIRKYHEDRLHEGPSGLLAAVRQRYWFSNARSTVRKITRNCVQCFRTKPTIVQPLMGNLPEDRVNVASPFEITGIDFAGPVFVKEGKHKPKIVKAYICVFVCLVSKAIHLELVSDLTTEAFLAALDRFVNRRAMVRKILSDNATNFTGASRELRSLAQMFRDSVASAEVNDFLLQNDIEWEFIPPRAPNFGGLWEAGVKVVKTHLTRTLGNTTLNFEEFSTMLTHVEAIVNSRPLYAISDDPNEPSPLTPAHLMLGRPLEAIKRPNLLDIPANRLSRWQYINQLRDQFWKRWSHEYLSTLQARAKWTKAKPNITVDMVVLLVEDNQPPQTWRLGRVIAVIPGKDQVVRVAEVKTSMGVFRRAINKLAPLPISDNALEQDVSWNAIPTRGENVRANEQNDQNHDSPAHTTTNRSSSVAQLSTDVMVQHQRCDIESENRHRHCTTTSSR